MFTRLARAVIHHPWRVIAAWIVVAVAAAFIMIVLAVLLRSLVAPLYLMASVGLGFVATLGATTLTFQDARGENGLLFMLPLIMYMFVVALGTDYNILMTARLREEAREGHEPRAAMAMLFTPSLTTLMGRVAWWPGHCDRVRPLPPEV